MFYTLLVRHLSLLHCERIYLNSGHIRQHDLLWRYFISILGCVQVYHSDKAQFHIHTQRAQIQTLFVAENTKNEGKRCSAIIYLKLLVTLCCLANVDKFVPFLFDLMCHYFGEWLFLSAIKADICRRSMFLLPFYFPHSQGVGLFMLFNHSNLFWSLNIIQKLK